MLDNDYEIKKNEKFLRKGIYATIEGLIGTCVTIWLVFASAEESARTLSTICLVIALIVLLYGIVIIIIGLKRKNKRKSFIDEDEETGKNINEEREDNKKNDKKEKKHKKEKNYEHKKNRFIDSDEDIDEER